MPVHGTLSTDKAAYDTLVVVTCDNGFKHAAVQTSKTVLCLDSAAWNDTDVDCQGSYRLWQSFCLQMNWINRT